jgi:hypothetical protein
MMADHAFPEILAMQQRTLDALLRSGRRHDRVHGRDR